MENSYYVIVVPKRGQDFRPCLLEYGITYEKAERVMRWYINDHGLRFKKDGKVYPALVQIHRIKDELPDGYYLFTSAKAVKL